MKLVCSAGASELFSGVAAIGVGSLAACAWLCGRFGAANCSQEVPGEIVFIGSCGLYDQSAPLLGVHEFSSAANVSLAELCAQAYRPAVCAAPKSALNSLEAITQCEDAARQFAAAGYVAENMEAAGVFVAARYLGAKARFLLVAANHVGPHAHEQYQANLAAVREILQNLAHELLEC